MYIGAKLTIFFLNLHRNEPIFPLRCSDLRGTIPDDRVRSTILLNKPHLKKYHSMGKFLHDFKEFALKGNVIDMAIGVIVGGAFGKIVTSLVNDILMPVLSIVTGGDGYKNLKYVITPASPASDGVAAVEEVAVNYGLFIQNIVDFVIIALCIFIALRVTVKFMKKEEKVEETAPEPEPSPEVKLLTEIRDELKSRK